MLNTKKEYEVRTLLKRNLDEVVYETICEGFVGNTYLAGKRLDPSELSERYEVSKTPGIQALKRMANEGILEITSGGKYIVPVASQKQIQDVCQARLIIEENALVVLSATATQKDIEELENINRELMSYYEAGSFDKYFLSDMHFHKKIVELAGNDCMADLHRILVNRYMVVRHTTGLILVHREEACQEHSIMIEALKKHDEAGARVVMRKHIMEMEERLNEKVINEK